MILTEALDKLAEYGRLQVGWDSYNALPPNQTAINNATAILNLIWFQAGSEITSIEPLIDGGIVIELMSNINDVDWCHIICTNDGKVEFEDQTYL